MKQIEQRFWVRTRAPLIKRGAHVERIENMVKAGTPDVHGLADGTAFWIELKAVHAAPALSTSKLLGITHGLNNDQINWHLAYAQKGGNNWVLIGIGSHEAILVHGRHALAINHASRDLLVSIGAAHVQRHQDWLLVYRALRNKQ